MNRAGSERAKLTGSLLKARFFLLATLVAGGLSLAGCGSSSPGTPATTTTNPDAAYLATAPVGAQPQWDDLDPLTDTIYVANGGTGYATGNTVSVINGRTCRAGDLAGCARRSPSVTVGRAPIGAGGRPRHGHGLRNQRPPHRCGDRRGHLQRHSRLRLQAAAS